MRRRNSGRCGADYFVFAWTAATKGDDRAQFACAGLAWVTGIIHLGQGYGEQSDPGSKLQSRQM